MTRTAIEGVHMFALGELGFGLALAWLVFYRKRAELDFRFVLLGSVLPDLIDKPLGASLHLEARLWAHSLLFLAALLAASLVPALRGLRWAGFGDAVHLLVDLIWQEPMVALWPLLGTAFPPGDQSLGGYFQVLLSDPYVQFGEVVGGAILIAIVWRYRLYRWKEMRQFLRDGRLVPGNAARGTTAPP